jgi:hypothetical protein
MQLLLINLFYLVDPFLKLSRNRIPEATYLV